MPVERSVAELVDAGVLDLGCQLSASVQVDHDRGGDILSRTTIALAIALARACAGASQARGEHHTLQAQPLSASVPRP